MELTVQRNLFGEEQRLPAGKRRPKALRPRYRRPLMPLNNGEPSKLEIAFWTFHNTNPPIYRLLVKFARQWRERRGEDAVMGIGQLFERVRWEISMGTIGDANFKLNNNHRAFYARLIMDCNPDLDGIFRLRRQRIPATIGPSNDELPSGEHVA